MDKPSGEYGVRIIDSSAGDRGTKSWGEEDGDNDIESDDENEEEEAEVMTDEPDSRSAEERRRELHDRMVGEELGLTEEFQVAIHNNDADRAETIRSDLRFMGALNRLVDCVRSNNPADRSEASAEGDGQILKELARAGVQVLRRAKRSDLKVLERICSDLCSQLL